MNVGTHRSPIGWMLEMVTSLSLGSSFSRAQDEKEEPLSESQREAEPKPSPEVKGLSLYLPERERRHSLHKYHLLNKRFNLVERLKISLFPSQVENISFS